MWIGLTGGIGSGKTTIANALREQGLTVYDTDKAAKDLIMLPPVREQIETLLGKQVFEGGYYHTDLVAAAVFARPDLLQALNGIVHPAVVQHLKQTYPHRDETLFIESAILYESGMDALCDRVVAVIAPKALRIERTMARDGKSREQVVARINNQMSNCQLRHRVDYVVENNGKQSVKDLTRKLLKRYKLI